MTDAPSIFSDLETHYASDADVQRGQMFGKKCLKVNGKAFAALQQDVLAFKLEGSAHANALGMKGAALWDPSGKSRPMKEWVAVPSVVAADFVAVATTAYEYVKV